MAVSDRETGIASDDISLEEKVRFLKEKKNYPHPTADVKAVKTHMSWVFLTDQFVYKLKIPFRYDHLKLLTPPARHHNCLEEIRLNKRLAEDIYLGVTPLSVDKEGNLVLGEGERAVDWLVKMKRLPKKTMLEQRIKIGTKISEVQLQPAAELLTNFYLDAQPLHVLPKEQLEQMKSTLEESRAELLSPEFNINHPMINRAYDKQMAFIDEHVDLFKKRIAEGRIIEGHGDLKPDHICLDPPAVIDCLEFSKQLRTLDVLDDLAFLGLECDRFGAPWVGEYFIRHYAKHAEDASPAKLISFYKSYRAIIRALLSVRHLREEQYQGDPKWRERAKNYLKLAEEYMVLIQW
ncbi:hypothetical protein ACG2F4_15010 [Halalkalibaculum sp. DA3122]|uniref:hypothetical protein n=1 Tax=unclassified Halalkalibaculum TaxID=2964617 RepID=UPI003753F898